ncbi:MAG: hypothetical protein QM758_03775 [Armatimonas sp.]
MKKVALTLALWLPALLAHADNKKDVQAFYGKFAARAEKEDLSGMKALVAENAKFNLPQRGDLTKAQWGRMIERTFRAMDKFSVRYKVSSVSAAGKGQVKVGLSQITSAVYKDSAGKPHTMEASRQLEDTLTRGKSGLLLTASKVKSLSQKIDGKPAK